VLVVGGQRWLLAQEPAYADSQTPLLYTSTKREKRDDAPQHTWRYYFALWNDAPGLPAAQTHRICGLMSVLPPYRLRPWADGQERSSPLVKPPDAQEVRILNKRLPQPDWLQQNA